MMKKNSIGLNSIIYTIKIFFTMLVPMITFPYASRVLGAEGIGKVNFCTSIVNYFVLMAGLGIQTYAIRECSKLRDKKLELEKTVREIFSINIYSTILSYICFILFVYTNVNMSQYKAVLFIVSLLIIATPLGMEWIYNVFEDFIYITIRTILIQIAAVAFLVVGVKSKEDILIYAFFTIVPTIGCNLSNIIHVNKYCKLKFVWNKEMLNHMKPIIILFASAITCTIYLNSDITMLGIIGTDTNVGYYTAATKLYTMLRNILFVIITVSLPRFNFYLGNGEKEKFGRLYNDVFIVLIYLVIPISVGLACVSEELIFVVCGESYENAVLPLKILAFALVPTMVGSFWSNIILVPLNKEKQILVATIIGAVFNVIVNVFIMPYYYEKGAAISTLLSEILVLCIHTINLKKINIVNFNGKHWRKATLASIPFVFISVQIRNILENKIGVLFVIVGSCAMIYAIVVYILNYKEINILCKKKLSSQAHYLH